MKEREQRPLSPTLVLLLLLAGTCLWTFPAERGGLSSNAGELKLEIEELVLETRVSLHETVQEAYLGYLGVEKEGSTDWRSPGSADSFFGHVNGLLRQEVQPRIDKGRELADVYFKKTGDRYCQDRIAFLQHRLNGLLHSNSEEYELACDDLREAVALAARAGDPVGSAYALNNLSYCTFQLGDRRRAAVFQRRAARMAKGVTDPSLSSLLLYNLGWIYLNSGQFEAAAPVLEESAAIAEEAGLPLRQLPALINLGSLRLLQGLPGRAQRYLYRAATTAEQVNSLRYRMVSAYDYALLLSQENQFKAAEYWLEEAAATFNEHGEQVFMDTERALLGDRVLQLSEHLYDQGAGYRQPFSSVLEATVQTKPLHSHLSHLMIPLLGKAPLPRVQQQEAAVRITMKETTTRTNTFFSVPVYLTTRPGLALTSITLEVMYPKGAFSFSGAEKGFRLHSSEGSLKTSVGDPPDPKLELIRIAVSQDEGSNGILPTGLILFLTFVVPKDVEHSLVKLQNKIMDVRTAEGRLLPAEQLIAESQTVYIDTLAPITICFFYMH